MGSVLPDERPDYYGLIPALCLGSLRIHPDTFKENATALIDEIVAPLNSAKIPFSSSHGNHDNQANITHLEEIMREQQVAPLSYTRIAPPGVGGNSADRAPVLILWFFDSRAEWGPMSDRGALAFVHIPPKLDPTRNPGLNADSLGSGSHVKNIHAVISGHDHGNEWCIREQVKDVIFCFDKHSGYGGYDGVGWGHGVRNIQFSSANPQAGPETWIRLEDGETRARITLNQHYQR
ncbi:hypothetical protein BD779DRAFT_1558550 [Infundibulicybe gibba]|nr:hypothetical protein BD779DRAFT_1558550 [Infundibulicybe gibba]